MVGILQAGCWADDVDTTTLPAAHTASAAVAQPAAAVQQEAAATAAQASDNAAAAPLQAEPVKPAKVEEKKTEAPKADAAKKEKPVKVRFQRIFQDTSYAYMMDTENARWIICPHTSNERIIDVWIKLVGGDDGHYSYPAKYYLEHYYIRPKTQQIQFLCELEVTGQPSNTVQQRPYSAAHWEDLVPESVEDHIYHAVVGVMGTLKKPGGASDVSILDGLEDIFRISL